MIRTACNGQRHIPLKLYDKFAARLEQPDLSSHKSEVMQLMASGNHNRAIAPALTISENPVKAYVNSLLTKLGVSDRTHAVDTASEGGIIRF